jgi:8-amino-7-oxononanoate synthase
VYDALIHASLRDGIRLSHAQSFSFDHNDVEDLRKKLRSATGHIFVVTESVFSMDGDLAPLPRIAELCTRYEAALIVDEAHATGVVGSQGEGLVQQLGLQDACFARIHTFGKACGAHGAIVLGSETLRCYLINFCRPFMYTTALPPSCVAAIEAAYQIFPFMDAERLHLEHLVTQFQSAVLPFRMLASRTPVQGIVIPGNQEVKEAASQLQQKGWDIRPILYPTVPRGEERLRIVLHAFNTADELQELLAEIQGLAG